MAEDDINNRIIMNFWEISHTMKRISEGKGSQKRILMKILTDEAISQSTLTSYLGIEPGTVSESIGKLENAGLVRKERSRTDGRTYILLLTKEGRAVAKEAFAKREERHEKMFRRLSSKDKEELLSLLEKLNMAWAEDFNEKIY